MYVGYREALSNGGVVVPDSLPSRSQIRMNPGLVESGTTTPATKWRRVAVREPTNSLRMTSTDQTCCNNKKLMILYPCQILLTRVSPALHVFGIMQFFSSMYYVNSIRHWFCIFPLGAEFYQCLFI